MRHFKIFATIKYCFYSALIALSALFTISCSEDDGTSYPAENIEITVLYTNDEHGWMEKGWTNDGAAALAYLWKNQEGYDAESNFIILSGGDNLSGQSISTFCNGESMIEVMNELGYSASTIGNHEFDFGLDILKERVQQAKFPFLSCNITDKTSGEIPDFITPYLMKEFNGVKVAVLGLTTIKTPYETRKENVENFEFMDYEEALDKWVPYVKNQGADIILLSCHVPNAELGDVRKKAETMGVSFIGAAHSHRDFSNVSNNLAMVEANCFLNKYAVAKITYNKESNQVTNVTLDVKLNKTEERDSSVEDIISKWKLKLDEELGSVIGYTDEEISRYSSSMRNMVCDSWLYYFPESDISVSNIGGLRAGISKGEISNASVMDVLPFDNIIYQLELKGSNIEECIRPEDLIFGGVYENKGIHFIDGREFHADSTYKVLISDYIYTSDNYKFDDYDSEPYNTSINWRVPLSKWIEDQSTNQSNSLHQYLDTLGRREK